MSPKKAKIHALCKERRDHMKLLVYKGFSADFLTTITVLPLVNSEIAAKKNVLLFDNKIRRALDRSLLNMDEDDEFWITYEE